MELFLVEVYKFHREDELDELYTLGMFSSLARAQVEASALIERRGDYLKGGDLIITKHIVDEVDSMENCVTFEI